MRPAWKGASSVGVNTGAGGARICSTQCCGETPFVAICTPPSASLPFRSSCPGKNEFFKLTISTGHFSGETYLLWTTDTSSPRTLTRVDSSDGTTVTVRIQNSANPSYYDVGQVTVTDGINTFDANNCTGWSLFTYSNIARCIPDADLASSVMTVTISGVAGGQPCDCFFNDTQVLTYASGGCLIDGYWISSQCATVGNFVYSRTTAPAACTSLGITGTWNRTVNVGNFISPDGLYYPSVQLSWSSNTYAVSVTAFITGCGGSMSSASPFDPINVSQNFLRVGSGPEGETVGGCTNSAFNVTIVES